MTDRLPPLSTPIALPSQPAFSLSSAVPDRDVARKQETVDEEPYTIKCICNFADDDGNTIFCETCETWQHIECYYPDSVEDALRADFAHSCVECQPRSLDRQQAIERQRARAIVPIVEEAADKKPRRPPSKSHKKKAKPSELHINGIHHGASESTKHVNPHDNLLHPAKKTKTSHKSNQSVSSQAPKRSPSHGTAKPQVQPLSPATTPPDLPDDFELHNYSSAFLSRYNDRTFKIVNTNSFAGLQVSNTMSAWLRDPEKMQKETGLSYSDVFQKLPAHIESIRVKPEVEQTQEVIPPDTVVQWQCLTAPSAIDKDVPLMEVNGQIGFQALYCAEPENRWAELTAPLPFVLFHPLLPLYIDTRREGSEARFVRRSCRPNAVLETYLSSGSEYHFWLVSDRQIAAREQITIPWDFRFPTTEKARALRMLGLSDDTSDDTSVDENDYQKYAGWVHLILSEHGGCACNLGPECAFARFRRNYLAKTQQRAHPPKSRKRKTKTQHAISPTSTGHATNSRAPSEGHLEDEQHRRSLSSSSRSKPPSRDMTPTARQGSFDTLGILTEPTDRDKRKVAMVEDTFRRLEQQQQQPQRKRKRVSDGTGTSQAKASKTGSATQTPTLPSGFHEREYMDVGTGPSMSSPGSPSDVGAAYTRPTRKNPGSRNTSVSARSRPVSVAPHRNYRDAAVQTDLPQADAKTPVRRVGSCLRKRLLENWHQARLEEEERAKRRVVEGPPSIGADADNPVGHGTPLAASSPTKEAEKSLTAKVVGLQDYPISDARPVSPKNTSINESINETSTTSSAKPKSPDLRVQLPPVPAFESPTSAHSSISTPVSAGTATVQSPFSMSGFPSPFAPPSVNGVAATPSPVKKKLSLSDYKSRMNKAAVARPPLATTLLRPSSSEDPKSATSTEGGGAVSSPTAERNNETGTKSATHT
ncbi:uncharacterized protein B0T15DRAFT_146004 [Chaetomium strumarium]|uniref:SET domain-containing protein n=1 Tax=Chaetomium strumarium TaxID=1170767 RepID=A0AAJ0M2E6_9PEZI|nr:hypothetical protein B0T15DRAFT_146004 [Chaetomium strumarium]